MKNDKTVAFKSTIFVIMVQFQLPSPLEQLSSDLLSQHGIKVYVKRDDLIHPIISGNKWRKLKYNIKAAKDNGFNQLLTFGGAFSNHIIATATAAKAHGLKSVGVIRGEEPKNWSTTLENCKAAGMQLKFISRTAYRSKEDPAFIKDLVDELGESYVIPEGGANQFGRKGCEEIISEIMLPFDYLCCSAGTGTTAAGILSRIEKEKLLVFPALKGGGFLKDEILSNPSLSKKGESIQLFENYHFGGYAKINEALIDFTKQFYSTYQLKLDLVYTAKLFYGVFDLINQGYFNRGSKLVLLHSGGLQGNMGFENRYDVQLFGS